MAADLKLTHADDPRFGENVLNSYIGIGGIDETAETCALGIYVEFPEGELHFNITLAELIQGEIESRTSEGSYDADLVPLRDALRTAADKLDRLFAERKIHHYDAPAAPPL